MIVEQVEPGFVKAGGHVALGDGKAYGVGEALAQRAGGDLDTGVNAIFRMAGRFAVQLPELLDIIQREVVAGEVEIAVLEHTGVAAGEDEAVPVWPIGVGADCNA